MPTHLAANLGVPVLPIVASTGEGVQELREGILAMICNKPPRRSRDTFAQLPAARSRSEAERARGTAGSKTFHERRVQATAEALLVLSDERFSLRAASIIRSNSTGRRRRARSDSKQPASIGAAPPSKRVTRASRKSSRRSPPKRRSRSETFSDKLDRVLTHKFWGMLIFVAIMALMFQSIFTFAEFR